MAAERCRLAAEGVNVMLSEAKHLGLLICVALSRTIGDFSTSLGMIEGKQGVTASQPSM